SCTGMYAPGIDIELIQALDLPTHTKRTAINFMGCYAAFNAIKTAHQIVESDSNAQVLIVAVELCSLHFQKKKDDDTLLANALFGDGAGALLISGKANEETLNLRLDNFYCDLAIQGKQEMAWSINDFGFEMRLTSMVPEFIRSGIKELTDRLLSNIDLSVSDIDYFAIHPGGKKILRVIEEELQIERGKNRFAHEVLRNYGNMSSPTIIFVLKQLMQTLNQQDQDKKILSFAFGPGLTLESMLLSVV
ncbi:MAG: type III polyketide synthase, partial [Bacteroidota bacterium]